MSNHRHLSRRQAERIIDASSRSAPAGSAESDQAVGPVLDALCAPARGSELRREDAMVAAFHTARLTPPTSTRSDMSLTARSAATRAAIATGVVVALSSGGFALAATDHLPTLPDQASDKATESVAKSRATSAPTTTAPATTAETTTATTTPTESESSETESAAPTPSLTGLCKAFQAGNKSLHGKALDSSAFTALAAAAAADDGKDVATYCVELVGEPKVKPPKEAKPTKAPKPTKVKPTKPTKPTKAPKPEKAEPTSEPTTQPTPSVKGKSADKGKAHESGKSATR